MKTINNIKKYGSVAIFAAVIMTGCSKDDDPVTPVVVMPAPVKPIVIEPAVFADGVIDEIVLNIDGPAGGYDLTGIGLGSYVEGVPGFNVKDAFVADNEINTTACLVQLMVECEFK